MGALLKEELDLLVWFEVRGNVDTQGSMGFLERLLNEVFRLACWGGRDGECSWMVDDSPRFVDIHEAKTTFGDGEGAPRSSVAIVGQLSDVLELVEDDGWFVVGDIGPS